MTAFGDLFADTGLPALQALHGELVTYRHAGDSDRTITAIIEEESNLEEQQGKVQTLREVLKVKVSRDATTGVATPVYGDAIVRGGLIYTHRGRVLPGNAGCWNLEFERPRPKKIGT